MKHMVLGKHPAAQKSRGLEKQASSWSPTRQRRQLLLYKWKQPFSCLPQHYGTKEDQAWPFSTPLHLSVQLHLSHPPCRPCQAPGNPNPFILATQLLQQGSHQLCTNISWSQFKLGRSAPHRACLLSMSWYISSIRLRMIVTVSVRTASNFK